MSTDSRHSGLASRRRYDAVQVDNLPDFLIFTAVVARLTDRVQGKAKCK